MPYLCTTKNIKVMVKITVQDAAKKYGCKDSRLYKAMSRHALTYYRELGRVYLDDDELKNKFILSPADPSQGSM